MGLENTLESNYLEDICNDVRDYAVKYDALRKKGFAFENEAKNVSRELSASMRELALYCIKNNRRGIYERAKAMLEFHNIKY